MISSYTLNTKFEKNIQKCFDINRTFATTEWLNICLPQMHALFRSNLIEKQMHTEINPKYNTFLENGWLALELRAEDPITETRLMNVKI